jgi:hypothetical protein
MRAVGARRPSLSTTTSILRCTIRSNTQTITLPNVAVDSLYTAHPNRSAAVPVGRLLGSLQLGHRCHFAALQNLTSPLTATAHRLAQMVVTQATIVEHAQAGPSSDKAGGWPANTQGSTAGTRNTSQVKPCKSGALLVGSVPTANI